MRRKGEGKLETKERKCGKTKIVIKRMWEEEGEEAAAYVEKH
jgi:hypothetical protein